jgi:hypothetical protein
MTAQERFRLSRRYAVGAHEESLAILENFVSERPVPAARETFANSGYGRVIAVVRWVPLGLL